TVLASMTFLVWLLRSKERISISHLRLIELVVVGLPLLNQLWLECERLFLDHRLLRYLQTGVEPAVSGRTHVLPWFILIIFYAILLPNRRRQCYLVVFGVAGLALAVNLLAAVADGVISNSAVLHHLLEVFLWLGFAVAFAVYNSYRIERLR